ncbi:MAG: low molecular weight phosphotyrosine protein phosphatase [Oscillospiraceae bacterium]|nr:low molecular weight phosphotyrosine protein phosphatase [Oscillospiraceae bacterium]
MIRVLFVCLGNICRSPMAECIFGRLLREAGLEGQVCAASAATSTEALGCDIHRGARQKLREEGVPFSPRQARQVQRQEYGQWDYIVGMEARNVAALRRIFGGDPAGKLHRLLDFSERPRDIADPWYTDNFDEAYADILEGCEALLAHLRPSLEKI